jgi:predicted Zn-dependent protease
MSAVTAAVVSLVGCQNAPISGRAQLMAVPEQEETRLGMERWNELLAQERLSTDQVHAELVEHVGRRIAAVAGRPDFAWEFKLFDSTEPNAIALPGGKVAVYEGILPVCENEAGLAVVMSHEIAHVLARHGGERMSQQGAVKLGSGVVDKLTKDSDEEKRMRWLNAYGAAARYGVILPYSRTHESEADSIGLMLMARAGYDPEEAVRFWERFAQSNGSQPPEFLSTHPCDAHRAADLKGLLPQALALYRAAPDKIGIGVAISLPANSGSTSNEIRLADHESHVGGAENVVPAAFEGEFVPPIQRTRNPDTHSSSSSSPPPFPTLSGSQGDDGWKPSAR